MLKGAIQWMLYEKCKKLISNRPNGDGTPTPQEYFVAASLSKFCAICATYPHEGFSSLLFRYRNVEQFLL